MNKKSTCRRLLWLIKMSTKSYSTISLQKPHSIDLRSDTVTRPSQAMRDAMATALVGDDVYGEDPTVNALERRCAELFGKESGIFVASGTMGNLMALMAHCPQRGDHYIVGQHGHMHKWEQGNYAQLAGVCATTLPNQPDGSIDLRQMEDAIYIGDDSHCAQTRMIALENTMNYRGGRVLSLEYMSQVRAIANRHNLRVHVDGARLFNAAIALKTTPKRLVQDADSVQMCFSKGLGAPIGSILCGDEQFIIRARRARKALGGGWRQAGILAAAAMVALDKAEETVTRDNENARRLGLGLNNLNSSTFHVDMDTLETNIVMVMVKGITADEVCDKLALGEPPILAMSMDTHRIRMVTNWDVNTEQIDQVIDAFAHLSEH